MVDFVVIDKEPETPEGHVQLCITCPCLVVLKIGGPLPSTTDQTDRFTQLRGSVTLRFSPHIRTPIELS